MPPRPAPAARQPAGTDDALMCLREALDALAGAPPTPEQVAQLEAWADQLARSGVLHRAPLSPDALNLLAQVLPSASVTSECRAHLERVRTAERTRLLAERSLDAECTATSPADLLRDLRVRAGLTPERTADLLGVTPTTLTAIEGKRAPWYQVRAEALPAFAAAVREPIDRLLTLIRLTARRALFEGVQRRAGLALGRFDERDTGDGRLDTLRMAFARVQAENHAAAVFLETARRAAGATDSPGAARAARGATTDKR